MGEILVQIVARGIILALKAEACFLDPQGRLLGGLSGIKEDKDAEDIAADQIEAIHAPFDPL